MGKLRQLILIVVGSLVALFAVVLASVNLYVQSRATQEKIQQELSQRLGAPLQIHGISVTPWGGLKLSGITIPQTVGSNSADFLSAKTFQLRVRFLSLFRKKLVIKQVSLIDPKVVWKQDAAGKWRLPVSAQAPAGRPKVKLCELHARAAALKGLSTRLRPTTRAISLRRMKASTRRTKLES